MSKDYQYQVSESAKAERKEFTAWPDALKLAKELSMKQAHPVYIEVIEADTEQLADFWYTVTKGRIDKHGNFARKGIA